MAGTPPAAGCTDAIQVDISRALCSTPIPGLSSPSPSEEIDTYAELVVVAAGRSASTRPGRWCGVAAAWLPVLLMVLPIDFAAEWLLIELPILGRLVAWFVPRNELMLKVPKAGRDVARAAAAMPKKWCMAPATARAADLRLGDRKPRVGHRRRRHRGRVPPGSGVSARCGAAAGRGRVSSTRF